MQLLAELEPFRHLSRQEVSELYDKNLVSDEDLRIKLNFPNFVRRFERENTNILDFGAEIPYKRKIEIIIGEFRKYAAEQIPAPANV